MKFLVSLALVLFTFCGSAQIHPYYNNVDLTLTGIALRDALSAKLQNSTSIPYTSSGFDTWDAVRQASQNPSNSNEVLLIYGWESGQDADPTNDLSRGKFNNGQYAGQWNREHVFPRSLAVPALTTDDPGPGTDFHNLNPCDVETNTLRGNLKFAAGSGNASIAGNGWYPGDEWKGDVARIVMYMYLRYKGNGSSVAQTRCLPTATGIGASNGIDPNMVNLFLQWNAEDPVSEIELNRNVLSLQHQNNRNPFIDNPAIATVIWGGPPAEDPWGLLEEDTDPDDFVYELSVLNLSNGVLLQWTPWPDAIGCEVKGGPAGGNDPVSQIVQGNEVSGLFVPQSQLAAGATYQWRVRCATGNNPISGLSPFSDYLIFTYNP
jgi:endonuclease I